MSMYSREWRKSGESRVESGEWREEQRERLKNNDKDASARASLYVFFFVDVGC